MTVRLQFQVMNMLFSFTPTLLVLGGCRWKHMKYKIYISMFPASILGKVAQKVHWAK